METLRRFRNVRDFLYVQCTRHVHVMLCTFLLFPLSTRPDIFGLKTDNGPTTRLTFFPFHDPSVIRSRLFISTHGNPTTRERRFNKSRYCFWFKLNLHINVQTILWKIHTAINLSTDRYENFVRNGSQHMKQHCFPVFHLYVHITAAYRIFACAEWI